MLVYAGIWDWKAFQDLDQSIECNKKCLNCTVQAKKHKEEMILSSSIYYKHTYMNHLGDLLKPFKCLWWRTTPVATKAWHYGAGGADTYAHPAPSTSEDEGSRVSLHQVRPSSRHELARVELSFPFPLLLWLCLARTCLSGPLHVSLSLSWPLGGFPCVSGP